MHVRTPKTPMQRTIQPVTHSHMHTRTRTRTHAHTPAFLHKSFLHTCEICCKHLSHLHLTEPGHHQVKEKETMNTYTTCVMSVPYCTYILHVCAYVCVCTCTYVCVQACVTPTHTLMHKCYCMIHSHLMRAMLFMTWSLAEWLWDSSLFWRGRWSRTAVGSLTT